MPSLKLRQLKNAAAQRYGVQDMPSLLFRFRYSEQDMLNKAMAVEECDATMLNSKVAAGYITFKTNTILAQGK